MKIEDAREMLWEDYLNLAQKYKDILAPYDFGHALIMFSVKLLMNTAPHPEKSLLVIKWAMEGGIEMDKKDREEQNKEQTHV